MEQRADNDGTSTHANAWLLTGTIVVAMFVPALTQRGMTWDGVLYATISRNMAVGICDCWHPKITDTLLPHFHEHPPLALWLESVPFRLFGDQFWIERLYSLATGLVTGTILVILWRHLLRDYPKAASCSWMMIVLWAACSHWAYQNNILENTLGIWTALSVYAALRAMDSERVGIGWAALAGVAITAALLTKGPVGLFPAVTPTIAWVTLRRVSLSKTVLVQVVVVACCAGSFALVLIPDVSREYWEIYWRQQVMASLQARREGLVASFFGQFTILRFLARDLTKGAIIAALVALLARRQIWVSLGDRRISRPLGFCLLTAFSASLPLIACPKQHGHYTAPSWPYYAFAMALVCLPGAMQLLSGLSWSVGVWRIVLLRCGAAVVTLIAIGNAALHCGDCFRDQSDIQASDTIAQATGSHVVIAVPHDVWMGQTGDRQFRLHAYLYRDHYISVWEPEPNIERVAVHMRLQPPDPGLTMSCEPIRFDDGFLCYPLMSRECELTAGRPGIRR